MLHLVKKSLFLLLVVPLLACAETETNFIEGEHYVELPKPTSTTAPEGKIEVVELFWYGCGHCFNLEPRVNKWVANAPNDVEFVRMPAVMARGWEVHARAYYASELLGVTEKTHEPLFNALHLKRAPLFDQESLAGFYAKHGVKQTDFDQAFKSFSVNSKIMKARKKQIAYRATGVPAVIVNGKYRVGSAMKAGDKGLFDVVNYLIEKERKAMQKG